LYVLKLGPGTCEWAGREFTGENSLVLYRHAPPPGLKPGMEET